MQAVRQEGSVVASLAELRAIEQERIAADRAAVRDAEQARVREREQAARRLRDEEAARIAAEHDAALHLVREREQAERAARLHIEATEAAERARHQAVLEEQRLAQEMELRRAEVAKKRPSWMLAVTGIALAAACGLAWFAVDSQIRSARAAEGQRVAELDKQKAVENAKETARQLARMEQDLAVLDARVARAIDDVLRANDAAARASAKAELDRLRVAQAELRKRESDAKARHDHDMRVKIVEITEECKRNPLAKNCVK
jgi:hypothetical protein